MTVPESLETEAKARVRLMLMHSASFRELIGLGPADTNTLTGNENIVSQRIHNHEVLENRNPENPDGPAPDGPAKRPLAIIHSAMFDYSTDSIAQFNEYKASGSVRVLVESQYLGDQLVDGQAKFEEFERLVGRIRTELLGLIQEPLGMTYYTAWHSIRVTVPPGRTKSEKRTETNDFFAVGWLFAVGNEGGE